MADPTSADRRLDTLHIRPIKPEDWRRLQLFHRRLSQETVVRRFHGAKRELSEPLAHRFTQLDGANDVALVATTGTRGRIVGVARYNRTSATCAEVAFVVEDAYQHHGVGRRLMRRLRGIALENGITQFLAEVLPGNTAMLHLLREAGATEVHFYPGELQVLVDLTEES
jgi:GNAT superfamily N-acetyltransferase